MHQSFTLESHYFESTSGLKLRYLRSTHTKSSTTLLLIHGIGGDATAWNDAQRICFENGISSVAIDLRGHGLSDKPNSAEDYKVERIASDVLELIEELELPNVTVVGHSFGGMVTLTLAKKNHPKIKGLVLISTNHHPTLLGYSSISTRFADVLRVIAQILPQGKKQVRPSYSKFVNTYDIHLTRLMSDIRSTSLKSFLFTYSHLFKYDATQILEQINLPTLVICGEKDIIFPTSVSKNLASLIKGAKYETVADTNHVIVISKPKELMEKITNFIGITKQ